MPHGSRRDLLPLTIIRLIAQQELDRYLTKWVADRRVNQYRAHNVPHGQLK